MTDEEFIKECFNNLYGKKEVKTPTMTTIRIICNLSDELEWIKRHFDLLQPKGTPGYSSTVPTFIFKPPHHWRGFSPSLLTRPALIIGDDMEENTMKNQPYNAIAVRVVDDEMVAILVSTKEPFLAKDEEHARTQFLLEYATMLNDNPDQIEVIVCPF